MQLSGETSLSRQRDEIAARSIESIVANTSIYYLCTKHLRDKGL